ncbi:MAG: AAA-like domain-containing protein [Candidatus Aminicenantes bacterium]|nr:MAG: AAA-like domain-containing protein [Candidatus Aminicenantes bacterium]
MKPDAPSYIQRKADKELYEHILKGDFCYVLTPRQMGKSSLMARTADRLKKEDVQSAIVDLTQIGTEKESADRWYYGIAYRIAKELAINIKLKPWWEQREKLSALQRLIEFFEDVVLTMTNKQVVLFVDEIDTTIALPFTDDFFAAVRACYNARATKIEYQRLNFVLLGVAGPSDLIKDTQRTPFNIGHRIDLADFTFEEARPLSIGLGLDNTQGKKALKRIIHWTGGHPYLTQKLCRILAEEKLGAYSDEVVDELVVKHFLKPGTNREESNLKFVSDRLLSDYIPNRQLRKLLKVYHRILSGDQLLDDPTSFTYTKLKLSGIVVVWKNQQLRIRNRIYKYIFNTNWVLEVMPSNLNRNITIFLTLISFVFFSLLYIRALIDTINLAQDDVPISTYKKLKAIPGFSRKADKLFAGYWGRRSLSEEAQKDRCKALIYQLKALTLDDTEIRRRDVSFLRGKDDRGCKNSTIIFRHESAINIVAINPDGSKLLTVGNDSSTRLWNTDTGKLIKENVKMESTIYAATFTKDGTSVLTGNSIGIISKWDLNPVEEIRTFIKSNAPIRIMLLNPTINSEILLTSDLNGMICLWDLNSGKNLSKITAMSKATIKFVVFHRNGKDILIGNSDNEIHLWKINKNKTVGKLKPIIKHNSTVNAAAFSSNGHVLTGSLDGTLALYKVDKRDSSPKPIASTKYGSRIEAVTFSIDEKNVIYATERWINRGVISEGKFSFNDKRFLPGKWTGAYRFIDDKGDQIQVVLKITEDSIKIYTIRFDKEDVEPIEGDDPDELLKEWQNKLALKLDEKTGKIEPMYPLEPPDSKFIKPPSVGGARPEESKINGKKIKNQKENLQK